MTTRKLASARRVGKIEPINGADKIVLAHVDGWRLVTAIDNNIMTGDLVCYFEIDSFLPVEERYEFLRKSSFKSTSHLGDGFRIKTIKLKGQISQGLIMPLERKTNEQGVPAYFVKDKDGNDLEVSEGDDLTEALGVQLWEQPIPTHLSGMIKGGFPMLIRKTDSERAQNIIRELTYDLDSNWEISLKLDGSSMTVYHKAGNIGVCSRNVELHETEDNVFWQVARKLRLPEMIKWIGKNVAFQGELMGPGVQGNREWLKQHTFFLFDIWNIDAQRYFTHKERMEVVQGVNDSGFELPHVPILEQRTLRSFGTSEDEILANLLDYADGPSIYNSVREGVVFKKLDGSNNMKVINNKYLLEKKD